MNGRLFLVAGLLLLAGTTFLTAQQPDWLWATQLGGSEYDVSYALAHDSEGNVYATGTFTGTAAFGGETLTSYGGKDIYIAKLNPQGQVLWARNAGGSNDDLGQAVAVFGGVVCVTGYFMNTASFGAIELTSQAWKDLFVAKLDLGGNWMGAYAAHSTSDIYAKGIAFDALGNACLAGYFGGTASFGAHTIVGLGAWPDAFVAKLDPAGNWLWALRAGGENSSDYAQAIGTDEFNNIYVGGYYDGAATFGPEDFVTAGLDDIWLGKLDSSGTWLWAKRAGGPYYDQCLALAIEGKSDLYIAGSFSLTAVFGPQTLTSLGGTDIFYSRLTVMGGWMNTYQAGGAEEDLCASLGLYDEDMVFLGGTFNGTAAFSSLELVSAGYQDVFAAKATSVGDWVWVRRGGGSGSDHGNALTATGSAEVYLGCSIFSTYSSFGDTDLVNLGSHDAVIAKLGTQSGSDDETATPAPTGFVASPNPFRASTRLSCFGASQGSPDSAWAEIYDLRGRLVRSLPASAGNRGELSATWDGLDSRSQSCPNGIYLVRFCLQGQELRTGRISLVK